MNNIRKNEKSRIVSNYLRLVFGLAIGLIVVRLLFQTGEAFFGIYVFITVGLGFSVLATELLRMGLVPTLGHDDGAEDAGVLREKLTAAFSLSILFAVVSAALTIALGMYLLPNLVTDSSQMEDVTTFLYIRAAMTLVVVSLTPYMCFLLVRSRVPRFNAYLFLERVIEICSVVAPMLILSGSDSSVLGHLTVIGAVSFILTAATQICLVIDSSSLSRKYLPYARFPKISVLKLASEKIWWSSIQVISMNLYTRFDMLFIPAVLGSKAAVVLGIAIRLTGYVRQATLGVINGVDSVFATKAPQGLSERELYEHKVQVLHFNTILQSIVVFQITLLIIFAREHIIPFWLGVEHLGDAGGDTLQSIVDVSLCFVLGMSCRCLNLGWMAAATGLGKAREFTPWMMPSALLNVLLITVCYYALPKLFTVELAGYIFLVLQVLTHFVVMPIVLAKVLELKVFTMIVPMYIPFLVFLATLACGLAVQVFWGNDVFYNYLGTALALILGLACSAVYAMQQYRIFSAN